jgi:Fe-S oxidoreductase
MDGTWGMKKEFYPISLQFARKAAREMEAAQPDTYATDCSLAALQIEDVRGVRPAHPVSLLREAYGLAEER